MKLIFTPKFSIGDKVRILAGEHNENWEGKTGKIVEIGVDLGKVAYLVQFKGEPFQPCFVSEDLKLKFQRKNFRKKIVFESKYSIGDKVQVMPKASSIKTSFLLESGESVNMYVDNHLPLDQINYQYLNKVGFASPVNYQYFNNMVYYLNSTENKSEIWKDKVGEIVSVEIDGTEKSHNIIYAVKYLDEDGEVITEVPCFFEKDLKLME